MEPDKLGSSISGQFATAWAHPIPVLVLIIIVGLLIWRAMDWRYGGIIERLKDENAHLKAGIPSRAREPDIALASKAKIAPPSLPKPAAQVEPIPKDERQYLGSGITVPFLMKKIDNLTSAEAQRSMSVYLNKWMKVTGTVFEVTPIGYAITVGLNIEGAPSGTTAHCTFAISHEDVLLLSKGVRVVIEGIVKRIESHGIVLIECELTLD